MAVKLGFLIRMGVGGVGKVHERARGGHSRIRIGLRGCEHARACMLAKASKAFGGVGSDAAVEMLHGVGVLNGQRVPSTVVLTREGVAEVIEGTGDALPRVAAQLVYRGLRLLLRLPCHPFVCLTVVIYTE